MSANRAFIFDLNGTMINDMAYHLKVWTSVLNELGAKLTEEDVRKNMYGKNHELLERVFGNERFTEQEANRISLSKEDRYQEIYRPHMKLIPGLTEFFEKASEHNILMAIGSAAIPYNIDFVLDNLCIRHYFKSIISAEDVAISKPHPEVFLKAASQLNREPAKCIVFEDAPKGVEAAANAGMPCVAITTMHGQSEFRNYSNILFFVQDYNDPRLSTLFD